MAQGHDEDYEERYYSSGRDSDDSPLLSYRYEAARRARSPSPAGRSRRSTVTALAKFFLFCSTMIMFCALLYIPVYNKAGNQVNRGTVAGWSIHTNRDTKVYVQPHNVTTIHEPKHICTRRTRNKKNNLFLLLVVSSATTNFDQRVAIRETWGHYKIYLSFSKIYNEVKEKYKDYNFTYDLFTEVYENVNVSKKVKRDTSFKSLLPELTKALQDLKDNKTEVLEEKRFDDDDVILPAFDMNEELNEADDYNYDDGSNVMKIPPRGDVDRPNINKVLHMLWKDRNFPKTEEVKDDPDAGEPDFKLLFLLGMPGEEDDTQLQSKIEMEVQAYGDILQEGFIDSYNNLTLKSIMMLKWVTNKCNESVRYILKTDDDMFINVPALMSNLRNRSRLHDSRHAREKEYLLIGDLISGATPIADARNKWYSPRYMYAGRLYPRYLSGTGYVLSAPAAAALYKAALYRDYFHLEDIYITGMCALLARPRIPPRGDPMFSYYRTSPRAACSALARATAHHLAPRALRQLTRRLLDPATVDQCERKRLTEVRKERLRPKLQLKPRPKPTSEFYGIEQEIDVTKI